MLAKAGRLWRTVRHLKPVQIVGRLKFRFWTPSPDCKAAPMLRSVPGVWIDSAKRQPSITGIETFCFLNEAGSLADGWDNPRFSKLWRYNLHYFDDLNASNASERIAWHSALIDRWVAENPPGVGSGWEPYPTSLRIVNWVKWVATGNRLSPSATHSLAIQSRWLMQRLEWHILGNHLFSNAKALIFAGCCFDGEEAKIWLAKGTEILLAQLPEQILADGGHFELSPMYHALALEDMLDIINVTSTFGQDTLALKEACASILPDMLSWFETMCHPDGEIAFFNDAAFDIAPSPQEITAYAQRLGFDSSRKIPNSKLLAASGYARLEDANAVVIADVAKVGPDYLPGHGHADTLSFEMSLAGRRLIVNSGTSVYGADSERLGQRGTAAHSTVIIDGQNSSEVWSGFRVGRRAQVAVEHFDENSLTAVHDGYRYLPGKPLHRRTFRLSSGKLAVTDVVTGQGVHDIKLHFHCPPWIRAVTAPDGRSVRFDDVETGQVCDMTLSTGAEVEIIPSSWHPRFGVSLPSSTVCMSWRGQLPFVHDACLTWSIT